MAQLTPEEQDYIEQARSIIRDLAHGYPVKELSGSPEEVCYRLSDMLGENYDFDTGDSRPKK